MIKRFLDRIKHRKFCKLNHYYCPDCIYHDFIFEGAIFRGNRCRWWQKGKKNDMKDFLKALFGVVIGILVTLMIVFSIAYIGVKWSKGEDEKQYNGGICPKCGGHYIYEQAVTHLYDTDYVYICDKCGDMIELDSYRLQERKE